MNRLLLAYIATQVVIIASIAFLVVVAPPEIPLYYVRAWGESQLASKWELFLIPVLLNLFNTAAFLFSKRIREDVEFRKIVVWVGMAEVAVTLLVILKIAITIF